MEGEAQKQAVAEVREVEMVQRIAEAEVRPWTAFLML